MDAAVDGARTATRRLPADRKAGVGLAVAILAIVMATIAAVFAFQAAGYAPCELCLKERLPYYAGMALAATAIPLAWRKLRLASRLFFTVLALLFLASTAFGAYHAGVEWGFWPGPTDCTGTLTRASSTADFLHDLQTVHVVRCDAAAIRVLGVSMAGWNVVVSLALAILAGLGAVRVGRGDAR